MPAPDEGAIAMSGTVEAWVESATRIEGVASALGLRVRVDTDAGREPELMEWYPLATQPDCSNASWEPERLRADFPLGARVVGVGVPMRANGGGPKVVAFQADDFGHMTRIEDGGPGPAGAFQFSGRRAAGDATSVEATWRADSREDFEWQRALRRLPSEDAAARVAMLRRMTGYHGFIYLRPNDGRQRFERLLREAMVSRAARRELLAEFDRVWGRR